MARLSARAGILVCLLGVLSPATARSELATPPVELIECGELDQPEFERLLTLELGSELVAAPRPPPGLRVVCELERIQLQLADGGSGWRLEREIPAPEIDAPDAERIVALAATQLYLAWLPLATNPPEAAADEAMGPRPTPQRLTRLARAAPPAPERAVTPRPSPPTAPEQPPVEVSLFGGARLRDAAHPFFLARYGALGAWNLPRGWHVLASLAGEFGTAHRTAGSITVSSFSGGAGAGRVLWQSGPFRLHSGALLSVHYLRYEAKASPGYAAAASPATAAGELELFLQPLLSLRTIQLGASLQSGVLLPRTGGLVRGGSDVIVSGPFWGASLHLGWQLRE